MVLPADACVCYCCSPIPFSKYQSVPSACPPRPSCPLGTSWGTQRFLLQAVKHQGKREKFNMNWTEIHTAFNTLHYEKSLP